MNEDRFKTVIADLRCGLEMYLEAYETRTTAAARQRCLEAIIEYTDAILTLMGVRAANGIS